jgi:hypothetical protein
MDISRWRSLKRPQDALNAVAKVGLMFGVQFRVEFNPHVMGAFDAIGVNRRPLHGFGLGLAASWKTDFEFHPRADFYGLVEMKANPAKRDVSDHAMYDQRRLPPAKEERHVGRKRHPQVAPSLYRCDSLHGAIIAQIPEIFRDISGGGRVARPEGSRSKGLMSCIQLVIYIIR